MNRVRFAAKIGVNLTVLGPGREPLFWKKFDETQKAMGKGQTGIYFREGSRFDLKRGWCEERMKYAILTSPGKFDQETIDDFRELARNAMRQYNNNAYKEADKLELEDVFQFTPKSDEPFPGFELFQIGLRPFDQPSEARNGHGLPKPLQERLNGQPPNGHSRRHPLLSVQAAQEPMGGGG